MNENGKTRTKKMNFTKEHYNSDNGMQVSVWGPCIWTFLHTLSFNYKLNPTEADKKHYRDFILSLQYILPCGKCRENLKKNFKKFPLTEKHLENRDTFSRYIYELHEVVNKMLNKKSNLTYEQVRDRFENFRARCNKTQKKTQKKTTHKGCSEPINGHIKSKCVIKIVPKTEKCNTLNISKKCIPSKK
jgi:Erv1 / Alr family